jgi:hypothetical protein
VKKEAPRMSEAERQEGIEKELDKWRADRDPWERAADQARREELEQESNGGHTKED